MADSRDRYTRLAMANRVFSPGSPIDTLELFSGRTEQLGEVLQAYQSRGQHAALYGERGVGKTSIASIVGEAIGRAPACVRPRSVRVACSTDDVFQTLWETVFRKLGVAWEREVLRPEGVRERLAEAGEPTLIVIDELDRLADDPSLSLLADTIKLLSDDPADATLVLVGVADSVDDLIGDHASIARALRQVRIPRMSPRELRAIVSRGMGESSLSISEAHLERVASLSEGLPYYTHALGLYAATRAIEDDRDGVNDQDIQAAILMAVSKSQQSILSAFNRATRSQHRDAIFAPVLLACALARKDELGLFAAKDVELPLSMITGAEKKVPGFARHLYQFSDEVRGRVLQKLGTERRHFYRFEDPMLQVFVVLDAISKGVLTEERVREIKLAVAGAAG